LRACDLFVGKLLHKVHRICVQSTYPDMMMTLRTIYLRLESVWKDSCRHAKAKAMYCLQKSCSNNR
jgi:hypothetical protein